MTATGWIGEGPDADPAMPVTERLLAMKQRAPGDTLALALARSRGAEARQARDATAGASDPDERGANLVSRGYAPGMVSALSMKLADVQAELEDEQAKIERGARRQEIAMREHAAGRIDAWAVHRMLDGDQGDAHRAAQLERRAESLRGQIAEAQSMISPPEARQLDGVEAAASRARALLAEVTRSQAPAQQAPPPFGSASRFAGRSTEHTPGGQCWVCAEGRRLEAARRGEDPDPPGAVVTTGYAEVYR